MGYETLRLELTRPTLVMLLLRDRTGVGDVGEVSPGQPCCRRISAHSLLPAWRANVRAVLPCGSFDLTSLPYCAERVTVNLLETRVIQQMTTPGDGCSPRPGAASWPRLRAGTPRVMRCDAVAPLPQEGCWSDPWCCARGEAEVWEGLCRLPLEVTRTTSCPLSTERARATQTPAARIWHGSRIPSAL